MANWCFNRLAVTGPDADVARLRQSVARPDAAGERAALSLQQIAPMPAEPEGTTSRADGPNGDQWRRRHWGTKWDVACADVEQDRLTEGARTLVYVFDSAGSPPEAALATLAERFPTCRFKSHSRRAAVCRSGATRR
jgi:hypothetical protein